MGETPGNRTWPRGPERYALVRRLIAAGAVRTEPVARAMLAVPRHAFVPPAVRALAYRDMPLTLRDRRGRRIAVAWRPSQLARVIEMLELERGMRVLQLGAGSGYGAALLRHVVGAGGRVEVVETNPEVARHARARLARVAPGVGLAHAVDGGRVEGSGARGVPGRPWDRIVIRRSLSDFPALFDEAVPVGGRLVAPFAWASPLQALIAVFERVEEGWRVVGWLDGHGDPSAPGIVDGARETRAGHWVSAPSLAPAQQDAAWAAALAAPPDRCPIALAGKPSAVDWRALTFWLGLAFGRRTFVARPGSLIGVVREDGSGAALGPDGCLRSWGSGATLALAELEDAVEGWARAGRPPIERFRVVCQARAREGRTAVRNGGERSAQGVAGTARGAPGDSASRAAVGEWISRREHHVYRVTLPSPG